MEDILFDYYFALWELLINLFLVGGVSVSIYWGMRRRWRHKQESLEIELAEYKAQESPQVVVDRYQKDFLHSDLITGLDYISNKSTETLEKLDEEQMALRKKQNLIIEKAGLLLQSAENVLAVSNPKWDETQELCNLKLLVQSVLEEFYQFAHSSGVTLKPDLDDLEPIITNRDSAIRIIKNVIHNAIKYSNRGGVVEVTLTLEEDVKGGKQMSAVEVMDTGRGIKKEDQSRIFDLHVREDGLIKPGSGLGLYLARMAARRLGGDVILVRSSLNQGSTFKIILPYDYY